MNKWLIIFSALLLIHSTHSIAQDHIKLGIKGGFSLSTLRGPEVGYKPGLQMGAVAILGANEPVFFQTELLLTQKGARGLDRTGNNFDLYYLEIPLMLGVEITERLSMLAGFQPALLLGGFINPLDSDQSKYRSKELNQFDYSTLIGAEFRLKDNLFLGIRYTHAYVPIKEDEMFRVNGKLPVNRLFGLYCGYYFR
jgi:opacity protein-like surface antigen